MAERVLHTFLLIVSYVLAMLVFWRSFLAPAPYGRYAGSVTRRSLASKWGWVAMELPAVLVAGAMFSIGEQSNTPPAYAFLAMWMTHYAQRAFIYPLLRHDEGKRIPLRIVTLGVVFNVLNGYLNGRWVWHLSGGYPDRWLVDPRFVGGAIVFLAGYGINRHADSVLHRLRASGQTHYGIPLGGLYHWVSCPNYLGEIIEWTGWAIATWSWAGLGFAVWTAANLAPRAWFHHEWYRGRFADYPSQRRALLPGVW
jgi:3-oxo-5-alpha-steroid 4-dehydrogenase 1